MIKQNPNIEQQIVSSLEEFGLPLNKIQAWSKSRKLVLITGLRRKNFGQGFINICKAIKELTDKFPEVDFVYPMYLNPNVRRPINNVLGEQFSNQLSKKRRMNIFFIKPLDYLPFVFLLNLSYIVLTDSGGIQEEAPGLGKSVLAMRNTIERPEALKKGTVMLVGTIKNIIIKNVSQLILDKSQYHTMTHVINPYGDGNACKWIINKFTE